MTVFVFPSHDATVSRCYGQGSGDVLARNFLGVTVSSQPCLRFHTNHHTATANRAVVTVVNSPNLPPSDLALEPNNHDGPAPPPTLPTNERRRARLRKTFCVASRAIIRSRAAGCNSKSCVIGVSLVVSGAKVTRERHRHCRQCCIDSIERSGAVSLWARGISKRCRVCLDFGQIRMSRLNE
jgi:hypothetical protein